MSRAGFTAGRAKGAMDMGQLSVTRRARSGVAVAVVIVIALIAGVLGVGPRAAEAAEPPTRTYTGSSRCPRRRPGRSTAPRVATAGAS